MTTIPGLPDGATPLAGTERAPIDTGAATYDVAVKEFGKLGELYSALVSGAAPELLDAIGFHFTTQGAGDPLATWAPPASIPTVAGFGPVASFTGGASALYQRRVLPCASTRIWEVEADVEQVSVGGGESPVARLGIRSLKSDFSDTSGAPEVYGTPSAVLTAGQIVTISYRFAAVAPTHGSAWADPGTAIYLRPLVQVNQKSDLSGPCTTSIARVRRLKVRDVTDSVGVETSTFTRTREKIITPLIVGGVLTIDFSLGNFFVIALNANITSFVIQGLPASGEVQGVTLVFVADGTGRAITWNTNIKWAGTTAPVFTSSPANTENWLTLVARNALTRIAGFFQGIVPP
jgi:hypothetical protein